MTRSIISQRTRNTEKSHVICNRLSRALQSVSWFRGCTNNYIVMPVYTSCGQTKDYPIVISLWPLCLERVQISYIICISFYHKTCMIYILRYGILVTFYFVCLLLDTKYTRFLMSDSTIDTNFEWDFQKVENQAHFVLITIQTTFLHSCGYDTCMIISSYSNTAQNQIVGDFVDVCFFAPHKTPTIRIGYHWHTQIPERFNGTFR